MKFGAYLFLLPRSSRSIFRGPGALGFGAAFLFVAAGIALFVLWSFQNRLIFEPDQVLHSRPGELPFPVFEVTFPANASRTPLALVHAWWLPVENQRSKTILYFHGNDGNLTTAVPELSSLRSLPYPLLAIDYRGYGASKGAFPTEQSVYEDAEAAWQYLVSGLGVDPGDLVLLGRSLGGAVAIELASHHPEVGGVIVESGFTSIPDLAAHRFGIDLPPLRLAINQRFESAQKLSRMNVPLMVIHGEDDDLVPLRMGEALFASARGRKMLVEIPRADHDNVTRVGGQALAAQMEAFVEQSTRQRTLGRVRGN